MLNTDYFTKVLEDDLKAVTKPQYVDQIPKAVKGTNRAVGYQLTQRCQVDKERLEEIAETLGTPIAGANAQETSC
jgi:ATP-binding cassette subfamily E protein 1